LMARVVTSSCFRKSSNDDPMRPLLFMSGARSALCAALS
jgi:hypothetical protein